MGCYLLVWNWFHDVFFPTQQGAQGDRSQDRMYGNPCLYTALNDFTGLVAIFFYCVELAHTATASIGDRYLGFCDRDRTTRL